MFKLGHIHSKLVCPKHGAFSYRRQLRWLQMRIRQTRHGFIPIGKITQIFQNLRRFFKDQFRGFAHNNQIRIIAYITGRCAKMDDRFGSWTLLSIGIHMRHHVMPHFRFARFGNFIIDIVRMSGHFRDLNVSDLKAQHLLSARKRDPKLSPSAKFFLLRKEILHFRTGISCTQRRYVLLFFRNHNGSLTI